MASATQVFRKQSVIGKNIQLDLWCVVHMQDDKIAEILAAIQSKNLFKIAVDPRDASFDFWQKGGKIVSDVNGRFPKGDWNFLITMLPIA